MKRPSFSLLRHLIVASMLSALLTFTPQAFAQPAEWTEEAGCVASTDFGDVATIRGVECLVANVLSVATTFIGLASFVMLIMGAFLYLTSGGSSKGTEAGKQTITYAVIGLIVAVLAFFALILISDFTGVDTILQFNLNVGE